MKKCPTNGDSQSSAHNATDGVGPAEFVALYEAGFRAGFASGRKESFQEGYKAGYADRGAQVVHRDSRAQESPAVTRESHPRRELLGLPCERCGCFYCSQEAQCQCCKTPNPHLIHVEMQTAGPLRQEAASQ